MLGFDPQVHRVRDDEFGPRGLIENVVLQVRSDIREEKNRCFRVTSGKRRIEMLENIQLNGPCFSRVEIPHVFARPAERLAVDRLQTREVDATVLEQFHVLFRKVVTDDANKILALKGK